MKKLQSLLGKLGSLFRYGDHINPSRDWLVLLVVSVVVLAASVAWNILQFARVTSGEVIGSATSTPVTSSVQLDSVQTIFNDRSTERSRYVSTYRFVDPSL